MSVKNLLLGVCESTTTAAIPSTVCASPILVTPTGQTQSIPAKSGKAPLSRRPKYRRMPRRRMREDSDSIIPSDAQVSATFDQSQSSVYQPSEMPNSNAGSAKAPGSVMKEPLITTSAALVAPDFTPNAKAPLDPSQVPQSQPIPAQAQQPGQTASSTNAGENDVLHTLIGQHAESFKPPTSAGFTVFDPTTGAQAANTFNIPSQSVAASSVKSMVEDTIGSMNSVAVDVKARELAAKQVALAQSAVDIDGQSSNCNKVGMAALCAITRSFMQ